MVISAEEIKRRTCQCRDPVFKYSKSSDYSVLCMKCFKPLKIREEEELENAL